MLHVSLRKAVGILAESAYLQNLESANVPVSANESTEEIERNYLGS